MIGERVLTSAVVGLLLLAACSSDDPSTSTTAVSPTPGAGGQASIDDGGADPDADRTAELFGRWIVAKYVLPGGALTNVVGDEPAFIAFAADGTVDYHTGCNAGGTTYSTAGTYVVPESGFDDATEGQPISMGPLFEQTEEGCEGFLGDQDRDLPANMAAATRFILDGEQLLLADEFLLIEATRSP